MARHLAFSESLSNESGKYCCFIIAQVEAAGGGKIEENVRYCESWEHIDTIRTGGDMRDRLITLQDFLVKESYRYSAKICQIAQNWKNGEMAIYLKRKPNNNIDAPNTADKLLLCVEIYSGN